MPEYIPIKTGIPIQASLSDLANLRWKADGIEADFIVPHDPQHLLRVSFDRACIVRLVDEMPLSTEHEESPNAGLVSEHFAYSVIGAVFERSQSEAWKASVGPTVHYRFVTGWACMDVLSSAIPTFELVGHSALLR